MANKNRFPDEGKRFLTVLLNCYIETSIRFNARLSASSARWKSISSRLECRRSSARSFAFLARSTSISDGFSADSANRSEERRVGKACGWRWGQGESDE